MSPILFPHISRQFPARILLWLALGFFIGLNFVSFNRPEDLKLLIEVFRKPLDLSAHLNLAQYFWQNGYWNSTKRELAIAQRLWPPTVPPSNLNILGTSNSPSDLWEQWEREPRRIQKAYQFWKNQAQTKPDYRDAFWQAGASAYQLGLMDQAKYYLSQAHKLDPEASQLNLFLKQIK